MLRLWADMRTDALTQLNGIRHRHTIHGFHPIAHAQATPLRRRIWQHLTHHCRNPGGANAQALLDFTLNPFAPTAPPTDAETVAALRHTADGLRQAAATGTAGKAAAPVAKKSTKTVAKAPATKKVAVKKAASKE